MKETWLVAVSKTTRPFSSLVTGTLTSAVAITGQGGFSIAGFSAGLAMTSLSMFGFAVNDILDYQKDRAAGIGRPVAAGKLSRKHAMLLAIAMLISTALFSILAGPGKVTLAITSALLIVYSPIKQKFPLFKGLYVAGLCCAPLYYGIVVGGLQCGWHSYAVLAAFVLGREIWMDSNELPGDDKSGLRTIAAILGRKGTRHFGTGLMLLAAIVLLAVTRGWAAISISSAAIATLAAVYLWPGLEESRRIYWSRLPMLLGAVAIAFGNA
jgi:4-hydroxybenzoate polyprenyltransferase